MKRLFLIILLGLTTYAIAYSQAGVGEERKGNKFYKSQQYKEAEESYRRAIDKSENKQKELYGESDSLRNAGKTKKAEKIAKEANDETLKTVGYNYNLANSLYKQKQYENAQKYYQKMLPPAKQKDENGENKEKQNNKRKPIIDSTNLPQAYYNYANSLLKQATAPKEVDKSKQADQQKLKESIEAYKQALRLNPSDMDAKANLAYAQKLLAKNTGGGGDNNQNQQNKDNKDNKDKNNKDKNNKDNKDKNDKDKDDKGKNDKDKNDKDKNDKGKNDKDKNDKDKDNKGKNDKDKNNDTKDNQNNQDQNQDDQDNQDEQNNEGGENQQQQQKPQISKQDMDRMLEAIQASEEQTKDKVDKAKAAAARKRRVDKNW